jgi:hypothetical protein
MKFADKAAPYIAIGWHVFPLRPGTRGYFAKGDEPNVPMGGFYWGTTDADKIDEWSRRWPGANIALRTGEKSGVVCIDLDFGKSGARRSIEILAAKGFIFPPSPAIARTPSGGEHWYYRYIGPLGSSASKLGRKQKIQKSGIGVRADGGLAILPPTHADGKGEYVWLSEPFGKRLPPLPRWVYDQLKAPPPEVSVKPYASPLGHPGVEGAAWRLKIVASQPVGTRNATLFRMAAQAADFGHSPSDIRHYFLEAAVACGLDPKSSKATIEMALAPRHRRTLRRR